MNARATGEPMNLNVHSGGIIVIMCVKSAGRWGRGLVSTRKASLRRSYGEEGRTVVLVDLKLGREYWRSFQDLERLGSCVEEVEWGELTRNT